MEAEKFIRRNSQNEQLFLELAEQISQDRRTDLSADDAPQSFEDWASERGLANRGLYAAALVVAVPYTLDPRS